MRPHRNAALIGSGAASKRGRVAQPPGVDISASLFISPSNSLASSALLYKGVSSMVWVTYSIQWIHEFLGIFWFGGVLYLNFVVIPAITKQPLENQRQISGTLSKLS